MEDDLKRTDITRLLQEWRDGNREAADGLMALVYRELHALASSYMSRERRDITLQPTALVHEAYMRLAGQQDVAWQNRSHFYGIAAQIMRRILVDHARSSGRQKRGARATHLAVENIDIASPAAIDVTDTLAIDDALVKLAAMDPQQSRIVELRFFGGLTIEETAEVMGLSIGTVKRDWAVARAWLFRELSEEL